MINNNNSVMNNNNNNQEKRQKIQWDEATIAEHDKERGTRQKIDEPPTPYRYLSESEGESDPDCLKLAANTTNKRSLKDSPQRNVMFTDHPSSSSQNSISGSWEIINAKLQYEKHLQDINDNNNNNSLLSSSPLSLTNLDNINAHIIQRKEFYSDSYDSSNDTSIINNQEECSESNHNNINDNKNGLHWKQYRGKSTHIYRDLKMNLANSNKIEDLQTNFGEIVHETHPAPAAFSPKFTRKYYYPNSSNSKEKDGTNKSIKPRTVFLPVISLNSSQSSDLVQDTNIIEEYSDNNNSSIPYTKEEEDEEDMNYNKKDMSVNKNEDKDRFLNKRAGHYNEYKVLQAMRAKLAVEEEEDDDDDA